MNEMPVGLSESLLVKPVAKANRFMVSQAGKAVALGLDSLQAYVDLGVAQVKVALKVNDLLFYLCQVRG